MEGPSAAELDQISRQAELEAMLCLDRLDEEQATGAVLVQHMVDDYQFGKNPRFSSLGDHIKMCGEEG